jgi:hypothetical protein
VVGCAVHQRTDGLYASRAGCEYLRDLLHRRDRNGIRQQERDGHDSDANTNTNANTDTHTHTDANTDTDTDANANANADTDAGTCTRAGTRTRAGTCTDTDANADADADANADADADANADADAIPLGPSGRDQSAAFKQHRHRWNFARHYRGVGDSECDFVHSLGGLG